MCPRKERYQTPEWVVKSKRNQRKGILYGPYNCPKCMQKKLQINLDKKNEKVTASCNCGFQDTLKYIPSYEPVDYFNKIMDEIQKDKVIE